MFVAIRTTEGKGYYLPVPPNVAEALKDREAVRVGFVEEPWLKPADRIVARFAERNGGIYDPVRHQRDLERLPPSPNHHAQPSPAERVTANVRRLERLARYRLVTRLPDGRWEIPPGLLQSLEDRERTHPQHRFRFERHGAPKREPVRSRADEERDDLVRPLRKALNLSYVADPSEFRGRLEICRPTPSGREYARIVNRRTGQFTVIAKPPGAQHLNGRAVLLRRDRDGGLSVQVDREISR
jgi:hypothetical protein